jgi:hypothetical protein
MVRTGKMILKGATIEKRVRKCKRVLTREKERERERDRI